MNEPKKTVSLYPCRVSDIVRVSAQMPLLRLRSERIDAVHRRQQETMMNACPPILANQERNGNHPPREILGDIGRMFGPPIRSVRNDAAIGQIGKTSPE